MNKTKHPRRIKIFHQTYSVKFDNDLCTRRGALGTTWVNSQEITLADEYDGDKIPQDRTFKVLSHEIVHAMLWEIGENKLYENEKFVENLGNALCSFLIQNCKWK